MTAVGWVGLGKLGLMCALACDRYGGHTVAGYDPDPLPANILSGDAAPPDEDGVHDALRGHTVKVLPSVEDVVAQSDVVFVAVQTPHAAAYGGETPAPDDRRDFEYAFLVHAVRSVCDAAERQQKPVTVVVVSTVLPGTCNRLIRPLTNAFVRLVYSPAFIAMGTTLNDFRDPEFVICGVDDPVDAEPLRQVHATIHDRPLFVTSIETAELIKVAYNVFISTKIVFANTLMEICHKTGADTDHVIDALTLATDRVISPRYLRGGMGDGGACHPRDLIAMSWLADRLHLSYDLLGQMAQAREAQTGWVADVVCSYAEQTGLPVVVLGKAYKPGVSLTAGSPALLLANVLTDRGLVPVHWDPHVDGMSAPFIPGRAKGVFVVATRHGEFADLPFASGSVVVDPFGFVPDRPGVVVVRLGRKGSLAPPVRM